MHYQKSIHVYGYHAHESRHVARLDVYLPTEKLVTKRDV